MRFLAPYPPHPGLPTLLLLILLAAGVWGAECELEACSEAYMIDRQGISEGPTIEYCSLVYRYIQCTTEYRSVCRGTIHYHSIQQMLNTFQTRNNCSEVLSGGVAPVIPDEIEEPESTEGEGCRYRGSLAPALCGLFGDPHLKTFDGQYMTCGVRGAWPLLNTPFLAIQVTNEAVGPDNTATATTKVTVIIKGHDKCGSERTYEASTDALPKAFVDGTTWSGGSIHHPYIEVREVHPGEYILITVSYINATVAVRKIKKYLTVLVTLPMSLLEEFDEGDELQLCRRGCPAYERLDKPGLTPVSVSAMTKDKAAKLCKEFNVTDYYLDSCIFDLVTTGDPSFRIAAQTAQKDLWHHDPIGAQKLLQNCSDPPCIWEITSKAPSYVPSLIILSLGLVLFSMSRRAMY
ncbi:repulsive guidance molecule B-like [Macrobrachium rosenbergii]|uniref:repulsive guidance molecule B-like n=1 Tax=Macrobrachium rosenbergii TaxID=79674 RepID=UPI0034D396A1